MVVAIKALACELPSRRGLPLAHWSVADLRREAMASGIVAEISGTTLWRWLGQDALRPWRHRSWLFPRDPQFARKAGRVIDLYQRCWKGAALGPHDYVLCIDEKTSIQARRRKHTSLPPAPGRAIYVEHEYVRAGALAYVAAWDVHRARLFGRCERKNSIAAFHRLVGQIMRREPYRSARRVFLITDNGSCHRGRRAADRLHDEHPARQSEGTRRPFPGERPTRNTAPPLPARPPPDVRGNRDAAGTTKILPHVLPVSRGDKEQYLDAARTGLLCGVACHRLTGTASSRLPVGRIRQTGPRRHIFIHQGAPQALFDSYA